MTKIGRNDLCPCGSGRKYKRCCLEKDAELSRAELSAGRFRFEPGSYGGPGRGYMPSIMCYREQGTESWREDYCLVNPDMMFDDEDAAVAAATQSLNAAGSRQHEGGGPQGFALSLRHEGYKKIPDFRIVAESGQGTVTL
jgi:hypothetical protein